MSRVFLPLLLILLLAATPLVGVTAQAAPPVVLRLNGHELIDCDPLDLVLDCFKVIEGDPATAFVVGQTVRVVLTAAGEAPHAIAVIDAEDKDSRGIMTTGAIAQSAQAESGQTVALEFTVPDVGTLYFWCPVGPHEVSGMFFEADTQPAQNLTNDTTDDDAEEADETGPEGGDDNETVDGNATAPAPTDPETVLGNGDDANATHQDTGNETVAFDEQDSPLHVIVPLAVLGVIGLIGLQRRRTA